MGLYSGIRSWDLQKIGPDFPKHLPSFPFRICFFIPRASHFSIREEILPVLPVPESMGPFRPRASKDERDTIIKMHGRIHMHGS